MSIPRTWARRRAQWRKTPFRAQTARENVELLADNCRNVPFYFRRSSCDRESSGAICGCDMTEDDMLAEVHSEFFSSSEVVLIPRMFALEEVAWLANEARVLRALAGPVVWIDDPDLRFGPFRRLAYHPRLSAALADVAESASSISRTTLLFARRGIISPSVPYWRAPTSSRSGLLAVVFLGDAEISVTGAGHGLRRATGAIGDVAVVSHERGLTATTDGHNTPLLLVQFGDEGSGMRKARSPRPPKLADDCLWQPAYWTAG